MWRRYRPLEDGNAERNAVSRSGVSGTGSASTLPMSDKEREEAGKQKRPIGFVEAEHDESKAA